MTTIQPTLRELAERATQLEWEVGDRWVFVPPEDAPNNPSLALRNVLNDVPEAQANCEYVVAAQPRNIIALLDRIEALEGALTKVRDAITSPINDLAVVDTVWMPVPGATFSIETLVDFIEAALQSKKPE